MNSLFRIRMMLHVLAGWQVVNAFFLAWQTALVYPNVLASWKVWWLPAIGVVITLLYLFFRRTLVLPLACLAYFGIQAWINPWNLSFGTILWFLGLVWVFPIFWYRHASFDRMLHAIRISAVPCIPVLLGLTWSLDVWGVLLLSLSGTGLALSLWPRGWTYGRFLLLGAAGLWVFRYAPTAPLFHLGSMLFLAIIVGLSFGGRGKQTEHPFDFWKHRYYRLTTFASFAFLTVLFLLPPEDAQATSGDMQEINRLEAFRQWVWPHRGNG